MTARSLAAAPRFVPLEQADFRDLEQAASLKGLLQPFKGKGSLETWANQCYALRDALITLAQRRVLTQAGGYPFRLLSVELAQQTTGAGTVFLRWRRRDRSAMGTSLWQELIASPTTPDTLIDDLHAMEVQRAVLNMQISLLHTVGRQARECASRLADAEATCRRRLAATTADADRPLGPPS